MREKIYYVYEHLTKDTNVVFYVGKGLEKRVKETHCRTKAWKNIVNKHGFIINIVNEFTNEDEALLAERETQLKHIANNIILSNVVMCGQKGASGYNHTEISKGKISARSLKMWENEEYRQSQIKRVTGLNNPTSDKKIYDFWHPIHGKVSCTNYEIRSKYNLSDSKVPLLINGKRFEHKKWRMFNNKDKNKPIQDNNIYKWVHPIHGIREKRKIDLMLEFSELLQPNLCKVIKGVQVSHKEWKIIK